MRSYLKRSVAIFSSAKRVHEWDLKQHLAINRETLLANSLMRLHFNHNFIVAQLPTTERFQEKGGFFYTAKGIEPMPQPS